MLKLEFKNVLCEEEEWYSPQHLVEKKNSKETKCRN